jgi:hypothetical protein
LPRPRCGTPQPIDRVRQHAAGADAQAAVVEEGAATALGGVELVGRRVEDHAGNDLALLRSSAIETANIGMPCRKLVVPSSGSTIQRCAPSVPLISSLSSPRKP